VGDNEGTYVFVLDRAFVFVVAAGVEAVVVGVVLEVALAALVADGAVQGVVGQQELHDAAAGVAGGFGVCVNLHGGGDLGAAGGDRFGALLDLDQTHAAVAGYFQAFVVAEAGDLDAVLLSGLEDGEVVLYLVGFVVDEDFDLFGGEGGVGAEQTAEGCCSEQH
jgi:hypothetical protein